MAFTPAKHLHQNYIPELDGLRGIAILLVVTFHYFGFLSIFSFGWTGVDLFFVLSGYLITSRLMISRKDKDYFSKFYKNRALRIIPLYYGVLIIFFIAVNLFVSEKNLTGFQFYYQNISSFFLFLQNWALIYAGINYENHLQHFWTLAVEEQFYLLWPFIIYFFSGNKNIICILCVSIICIIFFRSFLYFKNPGDSLVYFYNTFCRMDSFITGGLLYFLSANPLKKIYKQVAAAFIFILIAAIIFSGTKHSTPFMSTIGYTLLAIFFAAILYIALEKKYKYLNKILNKKWLIQLGKISYGLYIFHWVILRSLQGKIIQFLDFHLLINEQIILWLSLIICLIISIAVSVISYFYFELHFLKMKVRFEK